MLRAFTQLVSRLPFAGRAAIRPAYRSFIRAKKGKKHGAMAWLSSVLGFMIWGHGYQAIRGAAAMRLAFLMKAKWFSHVVVMGYTAANVAVTIAQVYLLALSLYYYFADKRTRLLGGHEEFSGGEILLMLVVTLGGQLLFMHIEKGLV